MLFVCPTRCNCVPDQMLSPAASDAPLAAAAVPISHIRRGVRSELMPTDALPILDVEMPARMPFACLGVAFAARVLLEQFSKPGKVPAIFDESLHPLCDAASTPHGIVSFVWTSTPVPHLCAFNDFVLFVVSRLDLVLKELVLAYALVEQLINDHPVYVQANSLRPIFLTACVVAQKVANDLAPSVASCHDCVCDVFTATSVRRMKLMEGELLFLLHFELPTGAIHQKCAPGSSQHRSRSRVSPPPHFSLTRAHPLRRALSSITSTLRLAAQTRMPSTKPRTSHRKRPAPRR